MADSTYLKHLKQVNERLSLLSEDQIFELIKDVEVTVSDAALFAVLEQFVRESTYVGIGIGNNEANQFLADKNNLALAA